jgi:hypothetical protein
VAAAKLREGGGGYCYEGRGVAARVFEKRRSDALDALDAKPMAHNQIPHPCPDSDK